MIHLSGDKTAFHISIHAHALLTHLPIRHTDTQTSRQLTALSSPLTSYLDIPRLVSWLSYRQYAPEGGFSGRTNKLVDGCYSHWVGGCFPLIEACLSPSGSGSEKENNNKTATSGLAAAPESLYNREGLIRYILSCCQDQTKRGGLRDKPYK